MDSFFGTAILSGVIFLPLSIAIASEYLPLLHKADKPITKTVEYDDERLTIFTRTVEDLTLSPRGERAPDPKERERRDKSLVVKSAKLYVLTLVGGALLITNAVLAADTVRAALASLTGILASAVLGTILAFIFLNRPD